MSDWSEEQSIYKAKKIGQLDSKPATGGKNRKAKPWKVMARFLMRSTSGKERYWEYVAYRGADEAACKAWITKESRSYFVRRQDQSERALMEAKQLAEERAGRYWIVGPEDVE